LKIGAATVAQPQQFDEDAMMLAFSAFFDKNVAILANSLMSEKTVADFSLPATGNQTFTLSGARGKHLVIYFYPKDNTPGCTTQAQQFRDLYVRFQQENCEVVGISRDSIKSHEKFKAQFTLPFALLSDADETACNLFGTLKLKNMYGKQVRGIERSTFVFDKDGILRREWRGLKADGHAQEVLDFVTTLN
jgi:peroxiredoxin Q/BCP